MVGFLDIFIYYKLGFREEGYFFESAVIIYTIIYSYNYGKKIKECYYVDVSNKENIIPFGPFLSMSAILILVSKLNIIDILNFLAK